MTKLHTFIATSIAAGNTVIVYNTLSNEPTKQRDFNEYREYGENNWPIDDWIKRQKDDPHDEMMPHEPMSGVADKDYEC